MKILALSSSRSGDSGYLENAIPHINKLLGNKPCNIGFIPFASVDSYQEYFQKVKDSFEGFPFQFHLVQTENAQEILNNCDVVMVGGGNTFKLLRDLQELNLIAFLRDKVQSGMIYIGWSAGSNILGPTIGTTNDMPVAEPESFNALSLVPFQINPHYFNQKIEGFNGETRDQRILEFLKINPGKKVLGLPEGTGLCVENKEMFFLGEENGYLFEWNESGNSLKKIEVKNRQILNLLA